MNFLLRVPCAAMALALAGCGASDRLETASVRGTVTLDGRPYTQPGGSVLFFPEGMGKTATGTIASDGTFELSTYEIGDGAVVGKHRVAVMPPAPVTDEATEGQAITTARSPIPKKYTSPEQSGLSFDVRQGRVNEFSIDLNTR